MSNDPVERARLAWLGARYRFQELVKGEPSAEEYKKATEEMERAKRFYEALAAAEAAR